MKTTKAILKPGTILNEGGRRQVIVLGSGTDLDGMPVYFCCLDRKGAAVYAQYRGFVNGFEKVGFRKLDPKRRKALINSLVSAWKNLGLNVEVR